MAASAAGAGSALCTSGPGAETITFNDALFKLPAPVKKKVETFLAKKTELYGKEFLAIIDLLASISDVHLEALDLFLADLCDFSWDSYSAASVNFLQMVISYLTNICFSEELHCIDLIGKRSTESPRDLLVTGYEILSVFPLGFHPLALCDKIVSACECLQTEVDRTFTVAPPHSLPPSMMLSVTSLTSTDPLSWTPFEIHRAESLVELSYHKDLEGTRNGECIAYHLRVLSSFVALMDIEKMDLTPFILTSVSSLLRHLFLSKMDTFDPTLDLMQLAEKSSIELTKDEITLIEYFKGLGFYSCQPYQAAGDEPMNPFLTKTVSGRWSKTAHIVNIDLALALLARVLRVKPIEFEPYHDEIPDLSPRPLQVIDIGQSRFPTLKPLSMDMASLFDYLFRLNCELIESDLLTLPALVYATQLALYQFVNGLNRAALACINEGALPPSGVNLILSLPTYPKWSPLVEYIALLTESEVFDANLQFLSKSNPVESSKTESKSDEIEEHPQLAKIRAYQNLKLLADVGVRHPLLFESGDELLIQGYGVSKSQLMSARDVLQEALKEVFEYVDSLKLLDPSALKV